MSYRLTKSTFVKGWQCPNLLWWEVNEPDTAELVPSLSDRHLMEQGQQVDRAARDFVPGGVLIPSVGLSIEDRIQQTQLALASDAPARSISAVTCSTVLWPLAWEAKAMVAP